MAIFFVSWFLIGYTDRSTSHRILDPKLGGGALLDLYVSPDVSRV